MLTKHFRSELFDDSDIAKRYNKPLILIRCSHENGHINYLEWIKQERIWSKVNMTEN